MFTPQNRLLCAAMLIAPHISNAIAKGQAHGETLDSLTDLALDITDRLMAKIEKQYDEESQCSK